MLTWKRPQKHHHVKERIFPVLPVQKLSKSVHGARRNLEFGSYFFCTKKLDCVWRPPFKGRIYGAAGLGGNA